jgi:acetylornithine deacetylase
MSKYSQQTAYTEAVQLLRQLIAIPSFSKEEHGTAMVLQQFLQSHAITPNRLMNNVWATNKYYDATKPTLLLNSHHDTVKPSIAYTLNPFTPIEIDGKLYGLGSNDAGGSLVSLLATFLFFYDKQDMKYNLVFAASAEEEISGTNGIAALLPELGNIYAAIVGEPTLMQMAVAEKGLLVLDCETKGIPGHAARNEGENAIYKSLQDIAWFQNYEFPKVSDTLGPVKMSLTIINAGTQHNVVPASCKFTVDVRVNDCYTNEEIVEEVQKHVTSNVVPRSMRLRSTSIDMNHSLVKAGTVLGKETFGSSTLSDKTLMHFPALKIGPGDSARSHIADEFIYLHEIEEGIDVYIKMLNQIL